MENLYLVTLNSGIRILIAASTEDIAKEYCLPFIRCGEWFESIEFIVVIGDDYHEEGEIIKIF